jgi:hypothetical protein
MNLYQHPLENDWKMGIKIDKSNDPVLYAGTNLYVSLLFNASKRYEKKLIDFGNIANQTIRACTKLKRLAK